MDKSLQKKSTHTHKKRKISGILKTLSGSFCLLFKQMMSFTEKS